MTAKVSFRSSERVLLDLGETVPRGQKVDKKVFTPVLKPVYEKERLANQEILKRARLSGGVRQEDEVYTRRRSKAVIQREPESLPLADRVEKSQREFAERTERLRRICKGQHFTATISEPVQSAPKPESCIVS